MPSLVLGPIIRHVDASSATVWMQIDGPCDVEILGARDRTFCIDDHHFALVVIEGLAPGADHPYEVALNGQVAWPEPAAAFPPSTIRVREPGQRLDLVFGSCRCACPHLPPHALRAAQDSNGQGVDALRSYALRLAAAGGGAAGPDLLLMLGDQIYADEPSDRLVDAMAARVRPDDAPKDELADFTDYALAYREAWGNPEIRWLMSTVPVAMMLDDHEIHAEWRISQGWLDELNAEPWFDDHIRAGLMAYWTFQRLGNLSPAERHADGLLEAVRAQADGAALLAAGMDTEGRQTGHSRWSWVRDLDVARLVVIDSRAGRNVTPGQRELIRDEEWAWVREQAIAPARHLLLASSVPFLLAPGLHHAEAFDEALTDGAWGRLGVRVGEWLRRTAVMDHWASFRRTFQRLAELLDDIAHGRLGPPPRSIVMLSGDVHHSYLAEVGFPPGEGHIPVWQAVCSAFRKELMPYERRTLAAGHTRTGERVTRALARAAGVQPLPLDWRVVEQPAYANQVATLTIDGDHVRLRVEAVGDDWRDPQLHVAFARELAQAAEVTD